jgi:hypothetical protein
MITGNKTKRPKKKKKKPKDLQIPTILDSIKDILHRK